MPLATTEITISSKQEGQRLDNILALAFPELSLRKRRLLWDKWHIFVDKKPENAGFRVRSGQMISLLPKNLANIEQNTTESHNNIELHTKTLHENDNFIFLYKPQGLHSTHIATGGPSIEANLPIILNSEHEDALLCNRLDAQTSGIVVIGKNDEARQEWLHLENYGKCQKRYVALVQESEQGKAKSCTIKMALNTDKRKKSRILDEQVHSLRHTHFQLLGLVDAKSYAAIAKFFPTFPSSMPAGLCFMGCTIFKGARHQIRAHAAHAGFALFNDHRYIDANPSYENECFLLHHGALILPHDNIYCSAPWEDDLPTKTKELITTFLQQSP